MRQKDEHYSLDDQGMLVENVGPWAVDKLKIVTDYIQASGAARRRYLGSGAAYIDVFCGPGRSRIRTTGRFIDPALWRRSKKPKARWRHLLQSISRTPIQNYWQQQKSGCRPSVHRFRPLRVRQVLRCRKSYK